MLNAVKNYESEPPGMVRLMETEIEQRLGYRFHDRDLFDQALTHKSASHSHNERLEFFGDAILGSVVSERLYRGCQSADEGVLSRVRSTLVNWKTLAQAAKELGLHNHVHVSLSLQEPGERIMADAAEALIGAAYLDGGRDAALTVIEVLIGERIKTAISNPRRSIITDEKMRLQICLQKRHQPLPTYQIISHDDSGHVHVFEVLCTVKGYVSAKGRGKTVKDAERVAAKHFLQAYGW